MDPTPLICIRADASPRIGAGHVMRCLALAARLRSCRAQVVFVGHVLPDPLARMVADGGFEWCGLPEDACTPADDAAATSACLGGRTADWLVIDHYGLDASWETRLRSQARAVLAIDDLADRPHDADLLLDQNLFEDPAARYAALVGEDCRMLLGPRYALLRAEFALARQRLRPRDPGARRLLVSFGGMDADDHTSVCLRALRRLRSPPVDVDVVIGPVHPQREAIAAECRERRYACHVQSSRMAELMTAADVAVGAGGITTWERCCLGLPSLVVVIAKNQELATRMAHARGLVYAPEMVPRDADSMAQALERLLDDAPLRTSISQRALQAVDGRGAWRVALAMGLTEVTMRRATIADSERIFRWRNHESVRSVSRDPRPIDAGQHAGWFKRTLGDPSRALLIGEQAGEGIGVVRFDLEPPRCEVSIYLASGMAGRGLGAELLGSAEAWLRREFPAVRCVEAQVLGHNAASQGLFESAGYKRHAVGYIKRFH